MFGELPVGLPEEGAQKAIDYLLYEAEVVDFHGCSVFEELFGEVHLVHEGAEFGNHGSN